MWRAEAWICNLLSNPSIIETNGGTFYYGKPHAKASQGHYLCTWGIISVSCGTSIYIFFYLITRWVVVLAHRFSNKNEMIEINFKFWSIDSKINFYIFKHFIAVKLLRWRHKNMKNVLKQKKFYSFYFTSHPIMQFCEKLHVL